MRFQGAWAALSNFGGGSVWYEGLMYPRSENAYQAAKTLVPEVRRIFADPTVSPRDAKYLGRNLRCRPDWEMVEANGRLVKVNVMAAVIRDKFIRNVDDRRLLISTVGCELVEGNNHGDKFWGVVFADGKAEGENWLGRLLMELRDELVGTPS